MSDNFSRRELLKTTGMIAVGLVAPSWMSTIARSDMLKVSKGGAIDPDCVLVVCQLSGGNDGLNTIVPYADGRYRELRPTLGIPEDKVIPINEKVGFHPALKGLSDLYKKGKVAVIQNVGYPNPNRSHFKSMDIWQSASPDLSMRHGWVGRHFDLQVSAGKFNSISALGLSTDKPLALTADKASIPCFASLADIQSMVGDPDAERRLRELTTEAGSGSGDVVAEANKTALDAMAMLRDRLQKYNSKTTYGKDKLGQGFSQVARLVATSPQTRVIYFSAGGFDTHANQETTHNRLLEDFSNALAAFQSEMEALGKDKKVMVLVFSEFGRRCYENASGGTDHGAAGPMFLVGGRVKGGLHGPMPDLQNLVGGDLKFAIDFRQVYATALEDWMDSDATKVLGSSFKTLDLIQ